MPDRRKHRGPHPRDAELFSRSRLADLRSATSELSWLLSRDYSLDSALKLVGDRYRLVKRQRVAVRRAAASDHAVSVRKAHVVSLTSLSGNLVVDGFNLIVSIEAAIAGGVLLRCRDGAIRDLASVHGSYRKVEETRAAIQAIGETLKELTVGTVFWLLDSPVSNSGRLAGILREYSEDSGCGWEVDLIADVDKHLKSAKLPVVTSDSNVLDNVTCWVNLTDRILSNLHTEPWIVDLG